MTQPRGPLSDVAHQGSRSQLQGLQAHHDGLTKQCSDTAENDQVPSHLSKALKDSNWRSRSGESGAKHMKAQSATSPASGLHHTSSLAEDEQKSEKDVNNTQPMCGDGGEGDGAKSTSDVQACDSSTRNDRKADEHNECADAYPIQGTTRPFDLGFATVKGCVPINGSAAPGPSLSLIKLEPVTSRSGSNISTTLQSSIDGYGLAKVVRLENDSGKDGRTVAHSVAMEDVERMRPSRAVPRLAYNEAMLKQKDTLRGSDREQAFLRPSAQSQQSKSASQPARNFTQQGSVLWTSQDTQNRWAQTTHGRTHLDSSHNNSGDSGYVSLSTNAGHSSRSVSEQSSQTHREPRKCVVPKQFNPRARDFLPLTGNQDTDTDQYLTRVQVPSSGPNVIQNCNPPKIGDHGIPTSASFNGHVTGSSALSSAQGPRPFDPFYGGSCLPFHHQIDRKFLGPLDSRPNPNGLVISPFYGNYPVKDWNQRPPPPNPFGPPPRAYASRRPVRKPRSPNAMAQNDYEAWIEHQKATTPGYALECRLRQQRRAQRKFRECREKAAAQNATSEAVSCDEAVPAAEDAQSTKDPALP
ncbi:hypothetical protein NLU13_4551 [Sarocladium strictum]|uniref:Uncharacterized protein n=1 Tax=Sarocladium strictum TaxID=5046 RepID=A0AA39L8A0_SARSR|nr:hypothetical protein NLU13_4551 [Sarocladium strictum]